MADESTPAAFLEVQEPDQAPRRFALDRDVVRIGRAHENELQVLDARVSKRHAEVQRRGARFHLVDVGSRAGAFVNDLQVQDQLLCDGDRITLGASCPVRITFVYPSPTNRDSGMRPRTTTSRISSMTLQSGSDGLERLAKFFEFSRMLGGGFELGEVLEKVVDLAIEVTGAERGMVVLRNADDSLDIRVARSRDQATLPADSTRVSETLVRQSLAHGRPRVVNDVYEDVDLAQVQSIMSLELRSVVTLPLSRLVTNQEMPEGAQWSGEVFGLLYLDSRQRRASFGRFDLGILETLARDASAVIENARLLGEAEERRRIERELKMARDVQAALIPEEFKGAAHFEIAGSCVPCNDLGGDYVDQFELPDGRNAFVVADVCGKGIAASLLAAALQGALAAEIDQDRPLGEVVQRVNRVICRLAPMGKFISMLVGVLDPDGKLRYVNAGHCPLALVRHASIEQLVTKGLALGIEASIPYATGELQLHDGDAFVLYTDGVIECEGPDRELFGDARLEAALAASRGRSARQILDGVLDAVEAFRRGAAVSDDSTALVIRYLRKA